MLEEMKLESFESFLGMLIISVLLKIGNRLHVKTKLQVKKSLLFQVYFK